jgi:hypothetical protein
MPDGDDKGDRRGQDCHHREVALSLRADGQLGLVSQEQLYELGFTLRQIRRRVAQGRLHREYHKVYAVGHRQLVAGSPPGRAAERRAPLLPQPSHRRCRLGRLVTVAVQKRLLRLDARDGLAAVEAALARHARWPGCKQLTAALAGYRRTESHKSQLEFAFDGVLAGHPEIPDPERNIYIDGWRSIAAGGPQKLVVELDRRPYHVAVRDLEKDRVKDAALQRLGFIPVRFTGFRFEHDLPGILSDLYHFLGITGTAPPGSGQPRRASPRMGDP